MRPGRALRDRESSFRLAEIAASARPVKSERRASIQDAFPRTISPERRSFRRRSRCRTPRPIFRSGNAREFLTWPEEESRPVARPRGLLAFVPASDASQRRDAARSILFRAPISRGGWVTISRLRRRDSSPTSVSRRGFPPSSLAGRCSASVSLRVARSGATSRSTSAAPSIVGTTPIESMILAHPCRAGARQSRDSTKSKHGMPGRCRHRALEVHGCP
jgi:hypothetical protein